MHRRHKLSPLSLDPGSDENAWVREGRLPLPAALIQVKGSFWTQSDTPLADVPAAGIAALPLVPAQKIGAKELAKGNGHGLGDGNGAGGNGKKDEPVFVAPRRRVELTRGEKEYLKSTVPGRGAPPYGLTIVKLVHAAALMAECLLYKSPEERAAGIGKLREDKVKLEQKQGELEDAMLCFAGRALKKIKGANETVKKHAAFMDRVLLHLEMFASAVKPVIAAAHRKKAALELERAEALRDAARPPLLDALGKSFDKVVKSVAMVLGAIFLETAANYWAHVIPLPAEVHYAILFAGMAATLYLGASWLIKQIKKDYRARITKEYDGKVKACCNDCRLAIHKPIEALAVDLIREFRETYPNNADVQMKNMAKFVLEKTSIDLSCVRGKDTPQFARDNLMAEMLTKVVCRPLMQ